VQPANQIPIKLYYRHLQLETLIPMEQWIEIHCWTTPENPIAPITGAE
jgi:hypothetical protein